MKQTRVKFCGLQELHDVQACIELGIDAIGCIFAPSPRQIDLAAAVRIAAMLPSHIALVGVFVNHDEADFAKIRTALPHMVPQFCGAESPATCERLAPGGRYLKVSHLPAALAPGPGVAVSRGVVSGTSAPTWLIEDYEGVPVFDTFAPGQSGGTGQSFAWSRLARPQRPFVLAGGLTPDNVQAAILALQPAAVDVRSGVETAGRKDLQRMRAFVEAVRQADGEQPAPHTQAGVEATFNFFSEHEWA